MNAPVSSKTMRGILIMMAYFILATANRPGRKDDIRALLDTFENRYDMSYHLTTLGLSNTLEQVKNILDQTKEKKSFSSIRFNRKNGISKWILILENNFTNLLDEEMLQHAYKMLSLLKKLINNPKLPQRSLLKNGPTSNTMI